MGLSAARSRGRSGVVVAIARGVPDAFTLDCSQERADANERDTPEHGEKQAHSGTRETAMGGAHGMRSNIASMQCSSQQIIACMQIVDLGAACA